MTLTATLKTQGISTESASKIDPIQTANGIYVTVHGHFYQPPRENPYLHTIERQPAASPFHDWNERIYYECYRPNAFARILNDRQELLDIVNNFEYLSFNVGPTLMSWLENYDQNVYNRIIEGDRKSCLRLNGHGNAIAQVYNHLIMPLANLRDKYTQIRWAKEDFRHRFGRNPEGMWLAETAVDSQTLETLIDEDIRFIILAPSQAKRCRQLPSKKNPNPPWHEVGGSQIDPTRPYRCFLNDSRNQYLDIFFYDGPISHDMGFNYLLNSTHHLVGRIQQAIRGDRHNSQIISMATDGETFGHHKKSAEKSLAYGFVEEFPKRDWTVTNFAHYLSINPPTWEVLLKPVTAWSCSHGVNRWRDDCGCGGDENSHQKWRKPLRDALDWLRDELIRIYEDMAGDLFKNPWLARDDYIQVILNRTPDNIQQFLQSHQSHPLSDKETIDALRLLEMQRHALLMYTSCGWFFEEISRPEGVQILRYANHALQLAKGLTGVDLETDFISLLKLAPSNVKSFIDGAGVYRQLVIPSQIGLKQIVAHYAISSFFTDYELKDKLYCYQIHQLDYQKQQIGNLVLVIGEVHLFSDITWEEERLVFAVLHLGGWDFYCGIKCFENKANYLYIKDKLFEKLKTASIIEIILSMNQLLGRDCFNLEDLFSQERYRIMQHLTANTKEGLNQLYTQVYRDNYGILLAFQRDNLPIPQELQVAAEISLSHRCLTSITALGKAVSHPQLIDIHLVELEAIISEANHLSCNLKIPDAKKILEGFILSSLEEIFSEGNLPNDSFYIQKIEQVIDLSKGLNLDIFLDPLQELYFYYLQSYVIPACIKSKASYGNHFSTGFEKNIIYYLLKLAQKLAIDVHEWLS